MEYMNHSPTGTISRLRSAMELWLHISHSSQRQIFQIHFTPFARQGSGQFTVVDILDIQPALEIEQTGITLDVTTTEVIEEATSKGKDKS
ncbi:hypothetical protein Tco_0063389, partial [Tanacetum coccineum]